MGAVLPVYDAVCAAGELSVCDAGVSPVCDAVCAAGGVAVCYSVPSTDFGGTFGV